MKKKRNFKAPDVGVGSVGGVGTVFCAYTNKLAIYVTNIQQDTTVGVGSVGKNAQNKNYFSAINGPFKKIACLRK